MTTGQTASDAAVGETSLANTLPAASARETFVNCTAGAESVSGTARSMRETVSPVPVDAYELTE